MRYDFNVLEMRAKRANRRWSHKGCPEIYYFMSDGDPSLDGGYLGAKIGQCYEALGDLEAAKYWYGRAVQENPVTRKEASDAFRDCKARTSTTC